MSLEQLKDQASHLAADEQRELIAFLVAERVGKDQDFREMLARKVDDNDPGHWVELDQLKQRYTE